MISFVVAALAAEWSLSSQQVGILTSTTSIGMVFGAAMAGFLADKYGRKNVLLWTLLIFSIASGLSALATGFIMLCLIRFIAGFGLGGELPVASTLVSESMPVHEREERLCCWKASGRQAGYYPHSLLTSSSRITAGGQPLLLSSACFYALYLRRAIEDSPRYIEQKAKVTRKLTFGRVASVWSVEHRRTSIMLWVLWFTVVFSYYGMFLWLPTVMVDKGFSLVRAFNMC